MQQDAPYVRAQCGTHLFSVIVQRHGECPGEEVPPSTIPDPKADNRYGERGPYFVDQDRAQFDIGFDHGDPIRRLDRKPAANTGLNFVERMAAVPRHLENR